MKSHKYKTGRRVMNWRVWVIVLTIISVWVMSHYGNMDNTYVAEKKQDMFMKPVVVERVKEESIEGKIKFYFPRSHKTMLAIAKAESGLSMRAKNWNCYYYHGKATTTPVKGGSRACKTEDRKLAHSVDCYVLQDNQEDGITNCQEYMTVDKHLAEMAELSKKCGLQCWSAYNNGSYKKYLAQQ
jgi:hypothetical protein